MNDLSHTFEEGDQSLKKDDEPQSKVKTCNLKAAPTEAEENWHSSSAGWTAAAKEHTQNVPIPLSASLSHSTTTKGGPDQMPGADAVKTLAPATCSGGAWTKQGATSGPQSLPKTSSSSLTTDQAGRNSFMADRELDDPLPMPELVNMPRVSQGPGAYDMSPLCECPIRRTSSQLTVPPEYTSPHLSTIPSHPKEPAASEDGENRSNLIEARAVDEEAGVIISVAKPMTPRREKPSSSKVRFFSIVGGLVVVLIIIILIVAVVVQHPGTDATTDSDSTNPTLVDNFAAFFRELPDYSQQVILSDLEGSSPQMLAYRWISADPQLDEYSRDRLLQRFALAVFYYATNGTQWDQDLADEATNVTGNNRTRVRQLNRDVNGPQYYGYYKGYPLYGCRRRRSLEQELTDASSIPLPQYGFGQINSSGPTGCQFNFGSPWLSYNVHECDWFNQNDPEFLDTCDAQGVFSSLYLSGHGLKGSLPRELALLTGMQHFFVGSNELTGTLPRELFTSWLGIKSFWIRDNQIHGTLPTEIENWSILDLFNTYGNFFTGTLPRGIYNLPNLTQMLLSYNKLTGTLAGDLLPGLKSIRLIGLGENFLRGTIPTELGRLDTLYSIFLEDNDLTGTIPSELGLLPHVEYFAVGKNDLYGTLPSELGQMNLNLTLSIWQNPRLTGSIPSELGSIPIQHVYLESTGLTGEVPPLWGLNYKEDECS